MAYHYDVHPLYSVEYSHLFVQGLDYSIASWIEFVFAEFPWVQMRHEPIEWSEPTISKPRTHSTIIVMYLGLHMIPMDCIDLKLCTFQIWTKVQFFVSISLLAVCMLSKLTLPCLKYTIEQEYDNTKLLIGITTLHAFNA